MKIAMKLAFLLCLIAGEQFAAAAPPPFRIEFGRHGLTVRDLKPGTRVAWMAMIREPRGYHTRVKILSGFGPVTPNSPFSMALDGADATRGIWTIADVDNGKAVHAASPITASSSLPIRVRAVAGEDRVEIHSHTVEVLYVRPRGGAWRYAVADGGGRDADGLKNGTIVMPLASLRPLKGNPHAPVAVEVGDLVLVIDPRGMRTASVEVGQ